MKKKKQKPPKIHLVHPVMMPVEKTQEKGVERKAQSWVIGRNLSDSGRGLLEDAWNAGEKALDAVAQHAIDSDNAENGLVDKSSLEGDGLHEYLDVVHPPLYHVNCKSKAITKIVYLSLYFVKLYT